MFYEAHSASPDLQKNLITAYINILQFWRESTKFLSGNCLCFQLSPQVLELIPGSLQDTGPGDCPSR